MLPSPFSPPEKKTPADLTVGKFRLYARSRGVLLRFYISIPSSTPLPPLSTLVFLSSFDVFSSRAPAFFFLSFSCSLPSSDHFPPGWGGFTTKNGHCSAGLRYGRRSVSRPLRWLCE